MRAGKLRGCYPLAPVQRLTVWQEVQAVHNYYKIIVNAATLVLTAQQSGLEHPEQLKKCSNLYS
jgi:hypothetical protein